MSKNAAGSEPPKATLSMMDGPGKAVATIDVTARSVRLDEMAGGAAVDLFAQGLREVLANIADEATKPDKARAIVLTVELVPNEDRSMAAVGITVRTKLAPSPVGGLVYLGLRGGRPVAVEDAVQASLFDTATIRRQ